MPDDNDKIIAASGSPGNSEVGLNGEMWGAGSDSADSMPRLLKNPDRFSSPPQDGSPRLASPVKMENPLDAAVELDSWMAAQDHGPGASRVPFTKREKEFLCCLIQKHVYSKIGQSQCNLPTLGAFNQKNTMSSFCRVPNTAWKAIETEYNSKDNVRPRSIKQLRKCWENLKHRGNIDPAALYSGKKLHGRTSLSGAFTLTTDGEEGADATLTPPKTSEGFIETTLEENDSASGLADKVPSMTPVRELLPTDLSIRRRSKEASKFGEVEDLTDRVFQRDDLNGQRPISGQTMTSPTGIATQLMASLAASTAAPPQMTATSSRPKIPRITNVRTVRSLKPSLTQLPRRRFAVENKDRFGGARTFSNFSMVAKTHTQKIHEMKVKLISARIKEHETNVQKINLEMQHAQAHHDVTMRLLRTKAAWYDAHLRRLERQLRTGDLSLVGEDKEEYNTFSEIEMQYDEEYE